jgi:hypothetical protein
MSSPYCTASNCQPGKTECRTAGWTTRTVVTTKIETLGNPNIARCRRMASIKRASPQRKRAMKTILLTIASIVLVVSTAQWSQSAEKLPTSSRRVHAAPAAWTTANPLGVGQPAVESYNGGGVGYATDGWYQGHIGFAPNDCCGRCANAWDGYCAEKEACGKFGGKLHGRCGKCGGECGGACGHFGRHCGGRCGGHCSSHCGPLSGLGRWSLLSAPDESCGCGHKRGCGLRHKLGLGIHHGHCGHRNHGGGDCCQGSSELSAESADSSAPVPPEPPELDTPTVDDSNLL